MVEGCKENPGLCELAQRVAKEESGSVNVVVVSVVCVAGVLLLAGMTLYGFMWKKKKDADLEMNRMRLRERNSIVMAEDDAKNAQAQKSFVGKNISEFPYLNEGASIPSAVLAQRPATGNDKDNGDQKDGGDAAGGNDALEDGGGSGGGGGGGGNADDVDGNEEDGDGDGGDVNGNDINDDDIIIVNRGNDDDDGDMMVDDNAGDAPTPLDSIWANESRVTTKRDRRQKSTNDKKQKQEPKTVMDLRDDTITDPFCKIQKRDGIEAFRGIDWKYKHFVGQSDLDSVQPIEEKVVQPLFDIVLVRMSLVNEDFQMKSRYISGQSFNWTHTVEAAGGGKQNSADFEDPDTSDTGGTG